MPLKMSDVSRFGKAMDVRSVHDQVKVQFIVRVLVLNGIFAHFPFTRSIILDPNFKTFDPFGHVMGIVEIT